MATLAEQTVAVSIEADTENSQPYLSEIASPQVHFVNSPIEIPLGGTDLEGDPVQYSIVEAQGNFNATLDLNQETGSRDH